MSCSLALSYFCIPACVSYFSKRLDQFWPPVLHSRSPHSLFGILFPEPSACWGCGDLPYTQHFCLRCYIIIITFWVTLLLLLLNLGHWQGGLIQRHWHILSLWEHVLESCCSLLCHQAMLSDFIWHFNGSQLHKHNSQLRKSIQRMLSQWVNGFK